MFEARPPAKINLTLEVLGRRPDGFHELRSTFLRVGLSDRLSMQPAPLDAREDRLTVTGLPGAPVAGNLVLAALDAVRAHVGVDFPPLEVTLEKRIPTAAGLGGGSSDAAATLGLAQAAWGVALSTADLRRLAAGLGSDVPFFVHDAAAAVVTGRGEEVTPIEPPASALLLVTPSLALSTAAVFNRYDEQGGHAGDANDLWTAAVSLAPALGELRERLAATTAREWLMSGSGATLFSLYPSVEEAVQGGTAIAGCSFAADTLIHSVDLVGPDPAWRYP